MKKSLIAKVPAWALSLMILAGIVILLFLLHDPKSTSLSTADIIGWVFILIAVTVGCYFICRTHPKSVFYTPFICNAVGIIGLISNVVLNITMPDYTTSSSEWIILVSGFVLAIGGAILGARIGARRIDQAE